MSKFNNFKSSVVAVTTSETQLLPRNNNRTALILFNQGSENINWYFEDNSTMYFTLEAGKGMYFPDAPTNQIQAVSASGSVNVSVMEG